MAGARPFKIHKGSGGLAGRAMSISKQMSGANNDLSFEFQRGSGGGIMGDSFILKEDGGFLLQENGGLLIL